MDRRFSTVTTRKVVGIDTEASEALVILPCVLLAARGKRVGILEYVRLGFEILTVLTRADMTYSFTKDRMR
ncbi:hypothetical protein M0802_014529 [Mischocyttarus mexicanus]|nr:hypothetical protein M0802_014529 [Mischocyttarus mexicanus]